MTNPLVSIVIPTKNSARTLELCLLSIDEQTYKNIEVIVVDQSSTDTTREVAEKHGAQFIVVPPSKNYTPPTKSRNAGAKAATGSIFYHLDSDMQLSPGLIEEAVAMLSSETQIGALIVHEKDIVKGFWSKAKAFERECYWNNDKIESARIVKREIFEQVGGYDESLGSGEDFDIHLRYKKISSIRYCSEVVFHNLGQLNLPILLRKKYNYGKTAKTYMQKYKSSGKSFLKEECLCFLSNYKKFLRHPILGIASLVLKFLELSFGFAGYMRESIV